MLDLVLRFLIALMIILSVLAMGMSLTFGEFGVALRRTRLLALGFVLNFLALPALMLALVRVFSIPGPVAVGLLLCAFTPGNGVGTLFVDHVRGDVRLSLALVLMLSVGSVVLTPILLGAVTGSGIEAAFGATTWQMIQLILVFQLLPLVAGLLLRRYASAVALRAQPGIARGARLLVLIVIAAFLATKWELFMTNGLRPLFVSVIAILASFALGWATPRVTRGERASLAMTSMIRNLALALLLATTYFSDSATIAAMLVYALLMFVAGFAIAAWLRQSTPLIESATNP